LAILDEATSALDEELEAEIYRILREVLPNTTIVSIGASLHADCIASTAYRDGADSRWHIRADTDDGGEILGRAPASI